MTNSERSCITEPDARLQFEALISDLSARFVALREEEVDRRIRDALESIRVFFDVDRCGLLRVHQSKGAVHVSHAAYAEGVEHVPSDVNLAELFPWSYQKLVELGENVAISRLSEVPPEGETDRRSWVGIGVRSSLTVPLQVGGGFRHLMALNSVREERVWPDAYLPRLRLLGGIFVNALERRRGERLLLASEARLRLAAESASLGLWDLDLETGRYWVTDKIRELFGFAPEDEIALEEVLRRIHPEDRGQVRQVLNEVIQTQAQRTVEYRVTRADGDSRWLVSTGRLQKSLHEATDRVMGVTFDITERKQMEVDLRDSWERVAAAADVARLGCYEAFWDEGRVVVDDLLREIIGLSPEEEPNALEYWSQRVHEEDRERVLEVRGRLLAPSPDPMTVQYRFVHPTNGQRWFQHSARALDCDAQGQAVRSLGVIHDITEQKRTEEELRLALEEAQRLKEELQQQNVYLSAQIKESIDRREITGESEPILEVLAEARRVAATDAAVLITGETGTGKELLARTIHGLSRRRDKPMVTVNCAALPATLVENELFGREKGAYTGAVTQQVGRFELAHGSTLFLDEIAELPLALQSKLLRVLQEGKFERLGSPRARRADVRVIAATNRDLRALLRQGSFRSDLYYRLNVFPLHVPPLRERRADIPLLVWEFVRGFGKEMGKPIGSIPRRTMEELQNRPWPGNIRELKNTIERAVILSDGGVLRLGSSAAAGEESTPTMLLEEVERQHLLRVLQGTNWRIGGRNGAAEQLGLNRTTLHSKLKKLGISRPGR